MNQSITVGLATVQPSSVGIDWTTLWTVLGGQAILIVVVGFLARSIILHWLSKGIEHHKALLKADADQQLERLRAELRAAEAERSAQYQIMQGKRAEVIEELYSTLIEHGRTTHNYVSEWSALTNKDNALEDARATAIELQNLFYPKASLYLSEQLHDRTERFIRRIIGIVNKVTRLRKAAGSTAEFTEQWSELNDAFEEAQPTLAHIRYEFKKIIGVEQDHAER